MPPTTRTTTCLFCSLCCPAGVALEDYGLTKPEYPGHTADSHHGLCYRGHFISELIGHPNRLHEALVREGDAVRAVAPAEALAMARAELPQQRDGLVVVIDGNLPCEELLQAARMAREGLELDRVCLFIPPADEAVLRGAATSPAARFGEQDLAQCDVLLAVGDPFATHPIVASPMLDALARERRNRLLNIDSVRGRTGHFATDFRQVRPGGEAAALAGVLRAMGAADLVPELATFELSEAAEMAGVEPGALEKLAAAMAEPQKLGVVVSLPEGRCAAAAAASALAAKVAEARGGGLCPLLTYGNAAGAWRLAAAMGTLSVADLMAEICQGRVKRLIALGTDIVSAVPLSGLSSVEIVLAASAMPTATTARARFVVPMAMWFEMEGMVVNGASARARAEAAAGPPRGALAPGAILRELAARQPEDTEPAGELAAMLDAGPSLPLSEVIGSPMDWAPPRAEGQTVVISRADGLGFADGALSRQLAWPVLMEPFAAVRLHPGEAAAPEGMVTLRSDGMAMTMAVEVSEDVPPGVVAISACFPENRMLFAWADRGVGPGLVAMETSGGTD